MQIIKKHNQVYVTANILATIHQKLGNIGWSEAGISRKVKNKELQQFNFEGYADKKNHPINYFLLKTEAEIQMADKLQNSPDQVAALSKVEIANEQGEVQVVDIGYTAEQFANMIQRMQTNLHRLEEESASKEAEILSLQNQLAENIAATTDQLTDLNEELRKTVAELADTKDLIGRYEHKDEESSKLIFDYQAKEQLLKAELQKQYEVVAKHEKEKHDLSLAQAQTQEKLAASEGKVKDLQARLEKAEATNSQYIADELATIKAALQELKNKP